MTTTAVPPAAQPATYRYVLAQPYIRVVTATRALAIAADSLRSVALSVLVFADTGSPLLAALTYSISFLPQFVGGMFFGALADRLRPRPVIAGSYAAECLAGLLLATGRLPVGVSLALVALIATMTPVFSGSSARVTAELLTGDAYVLGRSLNNLASSAAQLVGMAGGGAAVATFGARGALLTAAIAHLSAAIAVRLRLPDLLGTPADSAPRSLLRQTWNGNSVLVRDRRIRRLLLAQCLPPACIAGAESVIVPYCATRAYPSSAPGILLAAMPVGMIAGNFAVSKLMKPDLRERSPRWLILLAGATLIGFSAALPLAVSAGLLVLGGVGLAYMLGLQRQFLDVVPASSRGQAFGLLSAGLMVLQGVGPLVVGAAAQVIPIGAAIAAAGVCTLATAALPPRSTRGSAAIEPA